MGIHNGIMISSDLRTIVDNEKLIIPDLNIIRDDVRGKETLRYLKKDGRMCCQMMTFEEMATS